jgi:hypothetical protein
MVGDIGVVVASSATTAMRVTNRMPRSKSPVRNRACRPDSSVRQSSGRASAIC